MRAEGWIASAFARDCLEGFDGALGEAVRSADPELERMARHLVDRPGKRIRPALVFLAGELGEPDVERLRAAAVGVELVHIGSLYHDDIMDRAATRRGAPAASREWGDARAAVAGTFVLARGAQLFAMLGDLAGETVSDSVLELCYGQLQEAENAFNLDLPAEDHIRILARKTATLFDLPCRLGAMLARVPPEQLAPLVAFAQHVGVAFQLTDDALDLHGDAQVMGKDVGTDVRQGIYSLPVLLAAESDPAVARELRARLAKIDVTDADRAAVTALTLDAGGTAQAFEIADRHKRRAEAALEQLPEGPVRESLANLCELVTARSR